MKTYTITVTGNTETDILVGLDYIKKSIENGNSSGFDSAVDKDYNFESTGKYESDFFEIEDKYYAGDRDFAINEFNDLLNSDKDFNYEEGDFDSWVKDTFKEYQF